MSGSRRPTVATSRPSARATRDSSQRRPGSLGRIGQVVVDPSLKVDGLTSRKQSAIQDARPKRPPPARPKLQQASITSIAKQAETPKLFALNFSSLAGSEVTIQASRKDSCSAVQERLASQLNLPPYRISISSESGLLLKGEKTLEEYNIVEDADFIFVIGEANRWRDMPRDSFIELVVAKKLATRENLLRWLASQPANFDEGDFRQRYIPKLEVIEKAEELMRQHEEYRQHLQSSVASEASAMLSKLGALDAVSAMKAKIVDIGTAHETKMELARALREDAQRGLDEALPALRDARQALQSLRPADFHEVRSFTRPPAVVTMVGEAMCILFEVTPNWESTKKLWNDPQIVMKMQNYDKDYIGRNTIKRLDSFIEQPEFSPEAVGRVSLAARSMCLWVRAMHTYDRVAMAVLPKKAKMKEAEADLDDLELEQKLWKKELNKLMESAGVEEQS